MQGLQVGFVCTVGKPHRLSWGTYKPNPSDRTYVLNALPLPLQQALSCAFSTGEVPADFDLASLKLHLPRGVWVCHVCCQGLAAANALSVRVVERRPVEGAVLAHDAAEHSASKGLTDIRLRRHLHDKHGILNEVGAVEWVPGPAPHSQYCPEIEGKSISLQPRQHNGSAPEVRIGNPADWTYTYLANAESSDISAGRHDYERRPNDLAGNPYLFYPVRSQLMTLLYLAGLLCHVTRQSTMACEFDALSAAIDALDGGEGLPAGTRPSWTFLVGSSDPLSDALPLFVRLRINWPHKGSPIVTAIGLVTHVEKLANGDHRVQTLGKDGSCGTIDLPPSVKFWAGNVSAARAPFLCLFRLVEGKDGKPVVLCGYAHPVLSIDCLCTVESDGERNTAAYRLERWLHGLPDAQRRLVAIEKIEFTEPFGERHLMFDFAIRLNLPRVGRTLRFLVEHLGSVEPAYVAAKIAAKLQVAATTKETIIYVGTSHEREAIEPGLGGLEVQLLPIEQMLLKEAGKSR